MMSLLKQRQTERRIGQTEVIEKSGNVTAWVPTYLGGTIPGATTYATQEGYYMRIGPLVWAYGYINWTAATGTGDAHVSLPFAPNLGSRIPVTIWNYNVTFANGTPQGLIVGAVSYFLLISPLTNAVGANVQMEAAGEISFQAVYPIA